MGQRSRCDAAIKRTDAAMEAVFVWLDSHSPRGWRSGPPAHWVCDELTLADALTAGQLAVIPPCSYGQMPCDAIRFAWPVA
jgi:hypothetical protein